MFKPGWNVRLAIAGGVALIATSLGAVQADAAAEPQADPVEETAAVADTVAGVPLVSTLVEQDSMAAQVGSMRVEVPFDPDDGLSLVTDSGPAVLIGLPGSGLDGGAASGGNVVYGDPDSEAAIVARPTAEGAQALIVIDGPDAPSRFVFPIHVGDEPAILRPGPGGVVEISGPGRAGQLATVLPAWAEDANGAVVPTHFEIEGSMLVQIVDHHGASYPVVADPNTCGRITCTYYFGKRATKDIARAVGVAGICAVALKYLGPVGAGCFAAYGALNYQANRALNRNMCLKVKYTRGPVLVWYPDIYRGKACK